MVFRWYYDYEADAQFIAQKVGIPLKDKEHGII